jgi:hypothetical protein
MPWLFLFIFINNKNKLMINYLFVFLLSLCSINSFAQIKKSQVLIYGDSEVAWAAAVQSARSGVNTLWLRSQKDIGMHFAEGQRVQVDANDKLDAGLWAEFLSKTRGKPIPNDSISTLAKQAINPQVAKNVFTGISDSLKNLITLFNIEVKSIKKSGKQWQITLSNNDKLKVNAVVDASDNGVLIKLIDQKEQSKHTSISNIINAGNMYSNTLYRTGLIVYELEKEPSEIPASLVLNTPAENIFVIKQYPWLGKDVETDINSLPLLIQSGQAIGASAAYCAFFKMSTDKINIRTLQGELLAYHGQIIPFQDIELHDPHFSAIQRIGATGILRGETNQINTSVSFNFNPQKTISSKEIEPVLLNLYTRSQIWFSDKNIEKLTLSDLLSLIKFTALKGGELDADVRKGWEQRFHFDGEFDPNKDLTRRELAVLIDYYLKPFNVKVNEKGGFVY